MSNIVDVWAKINLFDIEDDIATFAKEHLGMVDTVTTSVFSNTELIEELEGRGYVVVNKITYYPNNSIIDADLAERFNNGFGEIPNREIEDLLERYGL